ncbi:hypothetical protein F383_32439 [Gossypium arboreum]|uniref:Uncharacterized protein n=1 Tax=Gossypium arboreum TaxID=29729 RepID=A0A0B0PIF1_GOSAR|nr:hypothetical protein F383_32439 [Gossypium arboreum]
MNNVAVHCMTTVVTPLKWE